VSLEGGGTQLLACLAGGEVKGCVEESWASHSTISDVQQVRRAHRGRQQESAFCGIGHGSERRHGFSQDACCRQKEGEGGPTAHAELFKKRKPRIRAEHRIF